MLVYVDEQYIYFLAEKIAKFEKEADWLAMELAKNTIHDLPCGENCNPCDMPCRKENWREAARKAVEKKNEAHESAD